MGSNQCKQQEWQIYEIRKNKKEVIAGINSGHEGIEENLKFF